MKIIKILLGIGAIIAYIFGFYFLGLLANEWNVVLGFVLIIVGEIFTLLVCTIDGIVSRFQFYKEEKEYKDNNSFKEIDDYNKLTRASIADKIMNINHFYDDLYFELVGNGTTESGKVLFQNEEIKLVSKKNDEMTKVKSIDNKKAQDLGRRRQSLERKKSKVNLLDEFGKQIILVAFIKFAYDSASAQFTDDKVTVATLGAIVTIATYLVYFLFIKGLKRPNDIYYLSEYEIKKIDKLMEDVDTPKTNKNWEEKKKAQLSN